MKLILTTIVFFFGFIIYSNQNATLSIHNLSDLQPKKQHIVDHSAWDLLLKKHVEKSGLVDYKGFKADAESLNNYVTYLSEHNPNNTWSREELLAYYINVYNANTIKMVVDHYPIKSIKDVSATFSPFLKRFIVVGNKKYSLNGIEKGILQKMNEPRIHFAINCASYSCPKLIRDAYTASNVYELMDNATKAFVNSENNKITTNRVQLSEIFKWYKDDFLKTSSSIIEFLNLYSDIKINKNAVLSYIDYNWNLNDSN